MTDVADYVRILEELGIDTDQLWPTLGHTGRILRTRGGRSFHGLYFNHRQRICYFTLNPRIATVEIDWNLWRDGLSLIEIPPYDRDKYNVVPKQGLERMALRSLLGNTCA